MYRPWSVMYFTEYVITLFITINLQDCMIDAGLCVSQVFRPGTGCCADIQYNIGSEICCGNQIYKKLKHGCCRDLWGNGHPFEHGIEICCNSRIEHGTSCCGSKGYYVKNEICCAPHKTYPKPDGHALCCGGTPHNAFEELCCGGELFDVNKFRCCGGYGTTGLPYYIDVDYCCSGKVVKNANSCCGAIGFNSSRELCCAANTIVSLHDLNIQWAGCCGENIYNSASKICCNEQTYPKETHGCCNNEKAYKLGFEYCCNQEVVDGTSCCGHIGYYPQHQVCCRPGKVIQKPPKMIQSVDCCNETLFDTAAEICCGGEKYEKSEFGCCGDGLVGRVYEIGSDSCCQGKIQRGIECCGNVGFNPDQYTCCKSGIVLPINECHMFIL